MKKLIVTVLICVLMLSALSALALLNASADGVHVYYDGTQSFRNRHDITSVTIKSDVTSIPYGAFFGCTKLESITIPEGVKTIGSLAFYNCHNLKSVTLPNSLNTIGKGAFAYCTGIESITVSNVFSREFENAFTSGLYFYDSETSTIKPDPLSTNNIEKTTLPKALKNITFTKNVSGISSKLIERIRASESFSIHSENPYYFVKNNCLIGKNKVLVTALSGISASIPNDGSVEIIAKDAFKGYFGLGDVVIPDSVTQIGESAFYASDMTSLTIPNSITSIPRYAFSNTSIKKLTIPNSVTNIGFRAFAECNDLTEVIIPESVNTIENEAFHSCDKLTKLTLAKNCEMGVITFGECNAINDLTVPMYWNNNCGINMDNIVHLTLEGDILGGVFDNPKIYQRLQSLKVNSSNYFVKNNCFIHKASGTIIVALKNATIPTDKSVTKIGEDVFKNRTDLKNITIPNNITEINNSAFYGCSGLTSISLPDGLTSIGDSAFYGCSGLTGVNLPNSLETIGDSAFYGCQGITSITIPNGITRIGDNAFMNTRLTDIVVPNTATYVGSAAFNCNTLKSATTHIAAGVINTGVDNLHIRNISEFSYQELGSFKSLTELTIPFAGRKQNGTVSTYFGFIFEHRYSRSEDKWIPVVPTTLKKVTLTNALRIDNECFSECSYIEEIILNEGVKTIGEKAFNRCFSLTTVTIPKSVNNIADDAFAQCDSLTTIRCYRNTKGEEIAKQLGVTIEYLDAICQTHSFGAWNIITDSTCTAEGLQTRTCTVCGTAESQVIPLKPHSFGEWVIVDQPQCNVQGTHSHTCFVCQYTELETMDATGHSFVFDCVIYDSTETSTGLLQEKCVLCGETVQKEIPLKTPQQPNVSTDSSNSENSNFDSENSNLDSETSSNDSETSNSNIASADSVSTVDENESGGNPVLYVLIGVGALLLVGAGVAVVIIKKKSKSDSANANASSTVEADEAQQPKSE